MALPLTGNSPTAIVMTNVSVASMPELPSDQSDSILVGTVRSAQTFRAGNTSAVYTEFQVTILDVLSTNAPTLVQPEKQIAVLQLGGVVRLPDGKLLTNDLRGIGKTIEVGGKYLFFLNVRLAPKCASITKTWDLSDGTAKPMNDEDQQRFRQGQSEFLGMKEEAFLARARRDPAGKQPID